MSEFSMKMFFAVCVAAIGSGFQHGYNTAVVNTPADVLKDWINETSLINRNKTLDVAGMSPIWSYVTSIYCFGGIIGGCLSGVLAKKLGPKLSLIINCVIIIVACAMEGIVKFSFARYYEILIVARLINGINSGLNGGICVMYCCDLSPLSLKGAMGSMYQLWITISILISMIFGMNSVLGNESSWHILLAAPTIGVGVIQLILLILVMPDSPRYQFIVKGNVESAQKTLKWLRKEGADIEGELAIMKAENDKINALPAITAGDFCKMPVLRKPLIIVIVMMLAQQLSGINAVVFFSGSIYKDQAGLSVTTAEVANVGFAVINVTMTIVSIYFVDKAGRKVLLCIAYGGLVIDTVLLMLCLIMKDVASWVPYMSILFIYLYIILFATGAGSIPWFIVSDMFEENAKPIAQAIGVTLNWSANFLVILSFDPIESMIGNYVFLIYIVFLVLTVLFILFFIPETKNRPVAEVQQLILEGKTTWKSGS